MIAELIHGSECCGRNCGSSRRVRRSRPRQSTARASLLAIPLKSSPAPDQVQQPGKNSSSSPWKNETTPWNWEGEFLIVSGFHQLGAASPSRASQSFAGPGAPGVGGCRVLEGMHSSINQWHLLCQDCPGKVAIFSFLRWISLLECHSLLELHI